jgi:hypothetical protein
MLAQFLEDKMHPDSDWSQDLEGFQSVSSIFEESPKFKPESWQDIPLDAYHPNISFP